MRNLFNFLRFRRQAPVERPPKGFYDLRVSKTTGNLILVDEDGTESEVGGTLSGASVVGGALAVTGNAIFGGTIGLSGNLNAATATATLEGVRLFDSGSGYYMTFTVGNNILSSDQEVTIKDTPGVLAIAPSYADESAANTAESPNVLYYNESTAVFQVTTA